MPDPFKIDAHVHVFTTDMPLIDNPRHAPTYSFTHEELIATLDANGVDRAVIAEVQHAADLGRVFGDLHDLLCLGFALFYLICS